LDSNRREPFPNRFTNDIADRFIDRSDRSERFEVLVMIPVLFSNALWIIVCVVWCLLCVGQAKKDRASGTGFQRPLSKDELDR
jgi:hypothetical protein